MVVRHHVEELRRLKYRPTGGFAQFLLTDAQPGVTWSVLGPRTGAQGGLRRPSRRPAARSSSWPTACPPRSDPAIALTLDVHVVSDLRIPLVRAAVSAELTWAEGHRAWHWEGEVTADSCVRIGRVETEVPDDAGEMVLDLTLTAGEVTATNRYTTRDRAMIRAERRLRRAQPGVRGSPL